MAAVEQPVLTEQEMLEEAEYQLELRELRRRRASEHPAFLGHFVHCIDAKTGDEFDFDLLTAAERDEIDDPGEPGGWHWHREILDSWLVQILSLELKARQIGITWLAALLALWLMLFRPGTRVLILSVNEEEAKKVVARIWSMYKSLPHYMRDHAVVTKPARGGDPSQEIELTHADDRKSTILALPATEKAGHGETAALVILDEYSRQDFAASIWKGVTPVIDGGGKAIVISTANGVHNELTGEGNYFHYLWQYALSLGIVRRFLSWRRHPDRDEAWRATRPMKGADLAEQYPDSADEAFQNSGECWFDRNKLNAYAKRWEDEGHRILRRLHFAEEFGTDKQPRARLLELPQAGEWRIYEEPKRGHSYAIAADVATGKGLDFSSAHVIDLSSGAWIAHYHARCAEDVYAKDLYYMARWLQREGNGEEPLIAVENQGGYGMVVIVALRDGGRGRRPYRNLYRDETDVDRTLDPRERSDYGFPMNGFNRPQVINGLEEWIREGYCPWIDPETMGELRTFAKAKTHPSPRALDGNNDDRVMSAGISIEMFRRYGKKVRQYKRKPGRKNKWKDTLYPWEK
jgi:hypothetical protein